MLSLLDLTKKGLYKNKQSMVLTSSIYKQFVPINKGGTISSLRSGSLVVEKVKIKKNKKKNGNKCLPLYLYIFPKSLISG